MRTGITLLSRMLAASVAATLSCLQLCHAQLATYPTLHNFTYGRTPDQGLTLGSDGQLYGVTTAGGANGHGTVFKISTDGTITYLHSFAGTDGAYPFCRLLQASDGAFYGTTEFGGSAFSDTSSGDGVLFRITSDGTYSIVHQFAGGAGGSEPLGGVTQASNGALYGTTYFGGATNSGTIYGVGTDGSGFAIHHSFNYTTESAFPQGTMMQIQIGTNQNLYLFGATLGYGNFKGSVYRFYVDRFSTANDTLTTIHAFSAADGYTPNCFLLRAADGLLYGSTMQGGAYGYGTLWKMSISGSSFALLHQFSGGADGYAPSGGLTQTPDGKLYGFNAPQNTSSFANEGSAFRLSTDGSGFQTVHVFTGPDGALPRGTPARAGDGNLYGATLFEGGGNDGTIFVLDLTPPSVTASCSPPSVSAGNRNSTVTVTVSGQISDSVSGVDTSSGAYSVRDSAGGTTSAAMVINSNGSYSFPLTVSSYTAKRTTRTYTITISARDKQGNASSTATVFSVVG